MSLEEDATFEFSRTSWGRLEMGGGEETVQKPLVPRGGGLGGGGGKFSSSISQLRTLSPLPRPPSRPSSLRSLAQNKYKTLGEIRAFAKQYQVTLKDTVESISRSILRICAENDKIGVDLQWYDEFYDKEKSEDLVQYIWRLVFELNAAKEPIMFTHDGREMADAVGNDENNSAMGRGLRCLLFALFYIDRMSTSAAAAGTREQQQQRFVLTSRNAHLTILGSMYLAHKFSDDAPIRMPRFAQLGGVSLAVLRRMEATILRQINFYLFISEDQFERQSMVQLDKAVRAAAKRLARQQQQQSNAPPTTTAAAAANYGLGGSTPVYETGDDARRRRA